MTLSMSMTIPPIYYKDSVTIKSLIIILVSLFPIATSFLFTYLNIKSIIIYLIWFILLNIYLDVTILEIKYNYYYQLYLYSDNITLGIILSISYHII